MRVSLPTKSFSSYKDWLRKRRSLLHVLCVAVDIGSGIYTITISRLVLSCKIANTDQAFRYTQPSYAVSYKHTDEYSSTLCTSVDSFFDWFFFFLYYSPQIETIQTMSLFDEMVRPLGGTSVWTKKMSGNTNSTMNDWIAGFQLTFTVFRTDDRMCSTS